MLYICLLKLSAYLIHWIRKAVLTTANVNRYRLLSEPMLLSAPHWYPDDLAFSTCKFSPLLARFWFAPTKSIPLQCRTHYNFLHLCASFTICWTCLNELRSICKNVFYSTWHCLPYLVAQPRDNSRYDYLRCCCMCILSTSFPSSPANLTVKGVR